MPRIDRTDKPTLRYRYPGGVQPMAEHDRIFAERRTPGERALPGPRRWLGLFRAMGGR